MKKILIDEYDKCLNKIIYSSDLIAKMALDGDIDRIDLYRAYLHTMVDKALKIKKLINNDTSKYNRDDRYNF